MYMACMKIKANKWKILSFENSFFLNLQDLLLKHETIKTRTGEVLKLTLRGNKYVEVSSFKLFNIPHTKNEKMKKKLLKHSTHKF